MKHIFTVGKAQEVELPKMTPSRILDHIIKEVDDSKDYLYLVMGKYGPTGKTWLYERLKENGYNAIELTEDIWDYVIYREGVNRYYINPVKKLVVVVLNELLSSDRGETKI